MTPKDAGYLTTTEAAALLQERGIMIKADTIKHWIGRGLLKAHRIGSGQRSYWLIRREDLEAFTPPKNGRPKKEGP
jgi:excisionase family DNA binding protein